MLPSINLATDPPNTQPGFQHRIQDDFAIDLDLLQMLDHNQDLQESTHRVTFTNNILCSFRFVVVVLYSKTTIIVPVRLALDLLMHTNVW